jgi:hypothetical protein
VQNDHDVIILGAGVGACLLAAELSRSANVLVLERRGVRRARSYGSIPSAAVESVVADDGATHDGDGSVWDLERLAAVLAERVVFEGGRVLTFESFRATRRQQMMEICADGYQYTTRLVIDCMEYRSPFLAANRFGRIVDTCVIQEGPIPVRLAHRIAVNNIRLSAHFGHLEILPFVESSHLSLVVHGSRLRRASNARLDWRIAVNTVSPEIGAFGCAARSTIVPILQIDRTTRDGFIALQDPEQQVDASACLRSAFRSYRAISASLLDCLATGDLGQRALARRIQKDV